MGPRVCGWCKLTACGVWPVCLSKPSRATLNRPACLPACLAPCQATSISPWVVTPAALEPFAVPAPPQDDPLPLPYLRQPSGLRTNYDVHLEVSILPGAQGTGGNASSSGEIQSGGGDATAREPQATVATRSSMQTMYWTLPQVGCQRGLAGWLASAGAGLNRWRQAALGCAMP